MKLYLILTATLMFGASTLAQATVIPLDATPTIKATTFGFVQEARNGADDGPNHDANDDHGGDRDDSSSDDGPNHDSDDDHSSSSSDDDSDDDHKGRGRGRGRGGDDDNVSNGNSSGTVKKSGRRKPRVPGGSGCDSAHDLVEHPECSNTTG
jgi:hypothetical protein